MSRFQRLLLGGLLVVIGINILGLWTVTYFQEKKLQALREQETQERGDAAAVVGAGENKAGGTATAGISVQELQTQVASLVVQVGSLSAEKSIFSSGDADSSSSQVASTRASTTVTASSAGGGSSQSIGGAVSVAQVGGEQVKEYVVYIGSGETYSRDWTPISSAVVTIDESLYPQLEAVFFEAAVAAGGGEAHARLINKDSGNVIFNSEVSHNTQQATWKKALLNGLESGNAEYQVEMKSTSGEQATLAGARLRIRVK